MLSWSALANIVREITCAMLTHNPQTTLHKKIIYNFFWIYLSQRCTRKLLVQYWSIWLSVYEENNLYNAASTLLKQHCTRKLLAQYWPSNILNNVDSFCSMLARLFIYDFWDNNEKGLILTVTLSQATFWKTNFLNFCE